jgi:hypothetical protein
VNNLCTEIDWMQFKIDIHYKPEKTKTKAFQYHWKAKMIWTQSISENFNIQHAPALWMKNGLTKQSAGKTKSKILKKNQCHILHSCLWIMENWRTQRKQSIPISYKSLPNRMAKEKSREPETWKFFDGLSCTLRKGIKVTLKAH